ncbi:MAG: hypothetical protein ACYC9R_13310, partial [Nitrosotalea sp.]
MSEVQVVNQGQLYATGCQLSWLSNTTLSVAAGQVRDSTNAFDMLIGNYLGQTNPSASLNVATTLNAAVNGLNGLDTGSLAANSLLYIYMIADPTGFKSTGVIASLNAPSVGPLMPFGYGLYRRVGQAVTDGSSHFRLFWQSGMMQSRLYEYDAPVAVVSATGSTSATAVAINTLVPSINPIGVNFTASLTPATAGNSFS